MARERDGGDGPRKESDRPSSGPRRPPVAPPAFPPDSGFGEIFASERRSASENAPPPHRVLRAFISPDDPIRKVGRGIPDEAFIAPDDPFVPSPRSGESRATGLGGEEPRSGRPGTGTDAPTIHELPFLLERLARRIQEEGDDALDCRPDTGRFEGALRSFLRGYLDATGGS